MKDNGEVCKFIEVGDGGEEDGRGSCDGNKTAGSDWRVDRKQRVVVVSDREDLDNVSECLRQHWCQGFIHTSGSESSDFATRLRLPLADSFLRYVEKVESPALDGWTETTTSLER